MDMQPTQALGQALQVHAVIDESHLVLDLGVAAVMPVADVVWQLIEEEEHVVVEGDFFDGFPILDTQEEVFLAGHLRQSTNHVDGQLHGLLLAGLAALLHLSHEFDVLRRVPLSSGGEGFELVLIMGISKEAREIDGPGVQHDQLSFQTLGRLDGLDRVLPGQIALPLFRGRELKEVRRGVAHAHRQRAEIVQGTNLNHARFHGVDDAGHQTDTDAVTQLGIFEAQVPDLAQHVASVLVAARVPAGG